MTNFISSFLKENLLIVIITLFLLITLSFKHKYVRRFYLTMVILVTSSILIYFLHNLGAINNSIYARTLEFVCLLMHMFEILVSLVFSVQTKVLENINYYTYITMIIYSFSILSSIPVCDMDIINYIVSRCTLIKTNFVEKVHLQINNKKQYNSTSNDFVVMLC